MTEHAAVSLPPEVAARALESLAEGVAVFDRGWRVRYINPAGAALLGYPAENLLGNLLWAAVPEMADSIFHSLLLRARTLDDRVTWDGFYAPTGRWWTVTAEPLGDDLKVVFRDSSAEATERLGSEGGEGERLRYLAEVGESLIGCPLDIRARATMLADLTVRRLCDWALVAVAGDDGRPARVGYAHRDPVLRDTLTAYLNGRAPNDSDTRELEHALLTGQPVHLPSVDPQEQASRLADDNTRAAWLRLNPTSMTIVPLRVRGETFGALALMNTGDRPPHTEAQIAEAIEVARRGALIIDNARLFDAQTKVAETLQRSLLTPPPPVKDVEIAVRYQPATSGMHVGGDWYDAFHQSEHETLLVIGDVVGHNVDAAATMGQIRNLLRGIACERPHSPAEVLARVDRVLTRLTLGALATALVACLDAPQPSGAAHARVLHWSSAGHLPPLLRRADGTVSVLHTPAERLLGTGSDPARTDHHVTLFPGDSVVFYTDGLIEHGRTPIDEGLDRLARVLADLSPIAADSIADHLLYRILTGPIADDSALLVLRLLPESTDPDGAPVPRRLALSESITSSPRSLAPAQVTAGIDRRNQPRGRRSTDRG